MFSRNLIGMPWARATCSPFTGVGRSPSRAAASSDGGTHGVVRLGRDSHERAFSTISTSGAMGVRGVLRSHDVPAALGLALLVPAQRRATDVNVTDNVFLAAKRVQVTPGDTVTWTNRRLASPSTT